MLVNPLICPKCGNNSCLLYPEAFASRHLPKSDFYWKLKDIMEAYLDEKMQEHIERIVQDA